MTHDDKRVRRKIWLKTVAVIASFPVVTIVMHALVTRHFIELVALSLAVSFAALQLILIASTLTYTLLSRLRWQIRSARGRRILPTVRELVAAHSLGGDHRQELRNLRVKYPDEVETCVVDALSSLAGNSLRHVQRLAESLGYPAIWRRQYRRGSELTRISAVRKLGLLRGGAARAILGSVLADPEDTVHVESARALIRRATLGDIENVFEISAGRSLLVRALLTNDLRPHAAALAARAIPSVFVSNDPKTILGAIEMICSWQVSMPLSSLDLLLCDDDPRVRAAALRAVVYHADPEEFDLLVTRSLHDADPEVRAAAATTAGRIRSKSALSFLPQTLHDTDGRVALEAAYALTSFGEDGLQSLEAEVRAGTTEGAPVAMEALARTRTKRVNDVVF